ncbi:hypothetical protein CPB83DRAFT_846868 [Crepidotus variabilis]|uniref:Uncharacterized protein n=1 Tax=Crepidotus variabilis TaxID=179855 RepID=A0A9P6EP21_9AGAR|nr:hypothetical protein CPB83DRAFT_846868 [Crepidotus variabilis]
MIQMSVLRFNATFVSNLVLIDAIAVIQLCYGVSFSSIGRYKSWYAQKSKCEVLGKVYA